MLGIRALSGTRLRWTTVLAVLVAAIALWVFIEVADEVTEGSTGRFDERVIKALRRADDPGKLAGPGWLGEVARDITALGGVTVLGLTVTSVVGYKFLCRRYAAAWLILIATVGGLGLNQFLKFCFERPRPAVVPHLSGLPPTASFPSGHAMLSATVYLTLGAVLAQLVGRRRLKFYVLGVAALLSFLVGVSRVYMGVHWPTDVLAGWSAGLVWAIVCSLAARRAGQPLDAENGGT